MKFIFADALDMIDPAYDFASDRSSHERKRYWGDQYPHEYLDTPPYDGVLVSRGIVGDQRVTGKYSESQAMRFRRVGAREFLRLTGQKFKNLSIFGDCGAFSYAEQAVPPYTPDDMVDFYDAGGFTHGCSVDHIIFDFDAKANGTKGARPEAKERFDITLENARLFLKNAKTLGRGFAPLGVVQGWSPGSMASAARKLQAMGYTYIALGGMVPLASPAIHLCLDAIRRAVKPSMKIHILGFAKAEQVQEFVKYGIASFDSTSPLIRAFKDAKANYYVPAKKGGLKYYTAVRIPQATENSRLVRKAKEGKVSQELLASLESKALAAIRAFDKGIVSLDDACKAIREYSREFLHDPKLSKEKNEAAVEENARRVRETLEAQPWKRCRCAVCRNAGVEVIIFRSSNRNKRRGFHNLGIYYNHLKGVH